jgi:UDP-N-acetylenolpyruvoylglucosamine reductase
MNFHGNLRAQLLKEVTTDTQHYNAMINDPQATDGDLDFFREQFKKRLQSTFAYQEQTRASHTLLKTVIEGMQ